MSDSMGTETRGCIVFVGSVAGTSASRRTSTGPPKWAISGLAENARLMWAAAAVDVTTIIVRPYGAAI